MASESTAHLGHVTINPYRDAAYTLLERMAWDRRPEAWRSRRKLRRVRGTLAGQKGLILCNGPSLNEVDFERLDAQREGVHIFGLNKINLLFERTAFRPDAIVAINRYVVEQNAPFFNATDLPLYLSTKGIRHIRPRPNIAFLHPSNKPAFARDVSISVHPGFTVTYVALQLAFHLGLRDVALTGCDHTFVAQGAANQVVSSGQRDTNHFDPRYFSGGAPWQIPDLAGSEHFYARAADVFAAYGGSIVNATVGGQLDLFPRRDLFDWLGD